MNIRELLFPISVAINFFSLTGLMIICGIVGAGSLAADIAVVQGAIVAVFLSLSGNARNLILASNSGSEERSLFYFRLIALLPAAAIVFILVNSTFNVALPLVGGLIIRKSSEWIAELQLANREKEKDFYFAFLYSILNTVALIFLVLSIFAIKLQEYFYIFLYAWAITPVAFSCMYFKSVRSLNKYPLNFKRFIPHLGSSTIVGVSTFFFRVLIVTLVGKALAGQMFSAYAIGGLLSSLYIYTIGPTLTLKNSPRELKAVLFVVLLCIVLGSCAILITTLFEEWFVSSMFMYGLGYSLVGGGLMILAQRERLRIVQLKKKDVFVPDALANMTLIMSLPLIYYLFGLNALIFLYLWSATLHIFFYVPLRKRGREYV